MFIALKFAFRQLVKTPGFTLTALATLAICLGANLTIFAVVDAILVRSLPFPQADRLVSVFNSYPGAGVDRAGASVANYFDRRGGAIKALASVSIVQDSSVIVGGTDSPNRVAAARVSPEFFSTLGVPLTKGQAFTDAQLAFGADQVAVLTDEFWRNHFNADPNVLGRTFLNDGIAITVVGVLPRNFHFLSSHAQFFRPLSHFPDDRKPAGRHSNGTNMIARLAAGASAADAQVQLDTFNALQLKDDPYAQIIKGSGYHTEVKLLRDDHVREVRPTLLLLQAGVLVLLLIGGVNLVNLLLIRANGRTKEIAVRRALGARVGHIARDIVVETTLLAGAGGVCGLLLGAFGVSLMRSLGSEHLPLGATIEFDSRVAAASLAAVAALSLLLAAPVIWFHLHSKLASGLQAESRGGTTGRGAQRVRNGFTVAQLALAFVLLSGAGLLGVSLKRVLDTPPGFSPDHVLTGGLALPWKNYKDGASRLAFVERLLPAVRALPGVTQVAVVSGLPFGGNINNSAVTVEGITPKPGETIRAHYISAASADYWQLMRIPLLRGRLLEDADNHSKTKVCVVDQAFADRYWPGGDPLGHRVSFGPAFDKNDATTVVGVVACVKQNELAEKGDQGSVYTAYSQGAPIFFSLLVRTTLPTAAMAPMVQKAVLALDPELPVDDMRPLQARIDDSLVARRSPAILASIFAAVALLLAGVGTYGVLSYAVTQRRREIGVRMALGAQPAQIQHQFLSVGLRLVAVGSALGILGSWLAGRAMQNVLFGVPALHAGTLAATIIVMGAVALLACLLPARRASRVDPATALSSE